MSRGGRIALGSLCKSFTTQFLFYASAQTRDPNREHFCWNSCVGIIIVEEREKFSILTPEGIGAIYKDYDYDIYVYA